MTLARTTRPLDVLLERDLDELAVEELERVVAERGRRVQALRARMAEHEANIARLTRRLAEATAHRQHCEAVVANDAGLVELGRIVRERERRAAS